MKIGKSDEEATFESGFFNDTYLIVKDL